MGAFPGRTVKKLFLLSVCLIAYFSLYPWQLSQQPTVILRGFEPLFGRSAYVDVVVNILFYMPVGLLGTAITRAGEGRAARVVMLAAVGAAVSVTLETAQAWIPSRDSTMQDVVINTFGTALGAWLAPALPQRPWPRGRGEILSAEHSTPPIMLLGAWLTSQWFPFLPILRVARFDQSLLRFTTTSTMSWIDVAETIVTCSLVSRLLRELLTPWAWRIALTAVALVVPVRLVLIAESSPWPLTIVGAGALLCAIPLARVRREATLLAALALALIVTKELSPFQFTGIAQSFNWMPFSGFLEASRDSALRVTSGKVFLYGATIWMLRGAGLPAGLSIGAVSGLLLMGEALQVVVPGRIAESTDSVVTLLVGITILSFKRGQVANLRH